MIVDTTEDELDEIINIAQKLICIACDEVEKISRKSDKGKIRMAVLALKLAYESGKEAHEMLISEYLEKSE